MKFKIFLLILSLFSVQIFSQSVFQLVESVPAETTLEKSTLPRAVDVWSDMIKSAKKTIDIEMFYIANENNEPLEKIINEIVAAANRGVKVRVMIDAKFFQRYPKSTSDFENITNITIKKIPWDKIGSGVMHAKIFIVDGNDLFVGSQNFDWRSLKHIHEMGAMVKSKELSKMFLTIYELDWKFCDKYSADYKKELMDSVKVKAINSKNKLVLDDDKYGKIKLYPAFSPNKVVPKDFAKEETELLKTIKNSKEKLYIQMFSYSTKGSSKKSPYVKLDNEIRKAAKRGVEVKIIFSDWAIKKDAIDAIKELSQVQGVEIKFSTMPQHSSGFIEYARVQHCKYFISDEDISWISTANWERGYFYESRNATLIIENSKINAELEKVFKGVWNSSYVAKVDVNKFYEPVKKN